MVLTEAYIREIVAESIRQLLNEKLGLVDEKLFNLASYIYDRCKSQTKEDFSNGYLYTFKIPVEEIKQHRPYNIIYPLSICVGEKET